MNGSIVILQIVTETPDKQTTASSNNMDKSKQYHAYNKVIL